MRLQCTRWAVLRLLARVMLLRLHRQCWQVLSSSRMVTLLQVKKSVLNWLKKELED